MLALTREYLVQNNTLSSIDSNSNKIRIIQILLPNFTTAPNEITQQKAPPVEIFNAIAAISNPANTIISQMIHAVRKESDRIEDSCVNVSFILQKFHKKQQFEIDFKDANENE